MVRISVVTPFFRGEKYLPGLVNMLGFTEGVGDIVSIQWIIVNDDIENLNESIIPNSSQIEIKVINTGKNQGTQGARITGVEGCDGDYVLMLDQDDRIFPEWFRSQLEHIGDADAVVCNALADGRRFYGDVLRPSFDDALTLDYNLSHTCGFIPGQVLMKKSAISEAWKRNRFSTNHCDDYYLWLCMMLEGKKFVKNPDTLYEHLTTGSNQSLNRVIWYRSMQEMIAFLEKDHMINADQRKMLNNNLNRETEACLEDRNWIIEKNMLLRGLLASYESGLSLSDKLLENGYKNAAIYGRAECGIHLAKKFISEGFEVKGFIDRAEFPESDIPVYKREDIPGDVECVINTLVKYEKDINDYLKDNYSGINVIHLRDLL